MLHVLEELARAQRMSCVVLTVFKAHPNTNPTVNASPSPRANVRHAYRLQGAPQP